MSDKIIVKYRDTNDDNFKVPTYATIGSAGCDLYSTNTVYLQPGSWLLVGTGLYLEIPVGYEAQVRPRSGLAVNRGITVLNSPGTIDNDYRGEVKVCLVNLGKEMQTLEKGERIAQLVFSKIYQASFERAQELSETSRGGGGFGSTGLLSLVMFLKNIFSESII
jgi:dUTP pyrophosphatase